MQAGVLQLIPGGELVTSPPPVPSTPTVRTGNGLSIKLALTIMSALMVTTQLPASEHAPPHPTKVELAFGVAVSVTTVPCAKRGVQGLVQLAPVGMLVTVPIPLPGKLTLRVWFTTFIEKSAVTC